MNKNTANMHTLIRCINVVFLIGLCASQTWIANTTRQYAHMSLNCVNGEDCKLYCSQYESCYYTTLNCTGSTSCYLRCDNHNQYGVVGDGHACFQMNIYGSSDSSILTIHSYDGSEQLTYSRIYAGDNGPYGSFTTYLQCGIDTYYPNTCYVGNCRYNTIYAIEGFHDIRITNAKSNCPAFDYGNKIICGQGNDTKTCSSFPFNTSPVYCSQTNSCSHYYLPSISPTNHPSLTPTLPTINPTQTTSYPTTAKPTYNPTEITSNPTKYPTINPTEITSKPTTIPTLYPSNNPSNSPTNIPTDIQTLYPSDNPTRIQTEPPLNDESLAVNNKSILSVIMVMVMLLIY